MREWHESLQEVTSRPRANAALAGLGHTVVKPAILLRRRFEGMMATSSAMRLLVAKSSVNRE